VPTSGLTDVNGAFYGTRQYGGAANCPLSCGIVFSTDAIGKENVLHRFKGGYDGAYPRAGSIDVNGRLYGTTESGGAHPCTLGGCGTVYTISTSGKEKVLYAFTGGSAIGACALRPERDGVR
jgi:uncharacterized repeat protein (TIGR03803 family)